MIPTPGSRFEYAVRWLELGTLVYWIPTVLLADLVARVPGLEVVFAPNERIGTALLVIIAYLRLLRVHGTLAALRVAAGGRKRDPGDRGEEKPTV